MGGESAVGEVGGVRGSVVGARMAICISRRAASERKHGMGELGGMRGWCKNVATSRLSKSRNGFEVSMWKCRTWLRSPAKNAF